MQPIGGQTYTSKQIKSVVNCRRRLIGPWIIEVLPFPPRPNGAGGNALVAIFKECLIQAASLANF